ncbi:HNH endonuclease [Corynebacterium sp. TAE3-ERU12]|uniref:HNH endonuclease n=1 Tax=Corynebacterium sp. TAE3-ERU12 TaxID=2849491 RepID=UPI001C478986|nr:HNH endonuclease signature motif containing protein [Corynebacterium sp. TAE3-ERU12]MBV7294916.1 HNH endonuclease [Corynebacterium sp. TAE3-ERU12]
MSGFRSNRRQRTSTGFSDRTRRRVLVRDGWVCQIRGPQCITTAAEVDHITPFFEGGDASMSNLRAVCTECHKAKTQSEAQRARRRFSRKRPPPAHPGLVR